MTRLVWDILFKSVQFEEGIKSCNPFIIIFCENGITGFSIKRRNSATEEELPEVQSLYRFKYQWKEIRLSKFPSQKERSERLIHAIKFLAQKYVSVLKETGF